MFTAEQQVKLQTEQHGEKDLIRCKFSLIFRTYQKAGGIKVLVYMVKNVFLLT